MFSAVRAVPPGVPAGCRGRLVEVDRCEWRVGDGGDPAEVVAGFCARYGGAHSGADGSVCGVAVMVSAAAGAVMAGGAAGAPSPVPAVPDVVVVAYAHGPVAAVAAPGRFGTGRWVGSWAAADHAEAVGAVQEAIGRGEVYQACVVGHRRASWRGDPGAAVAAVSGVGGAVWGGALAGRDWLVASGSPECFLDCVFDEGGGGAVSSFPIKGTAAATAAGRAGLLSSVKERAEHVMIVDLVRNDLARVAVPGSVGVSGLFTVRRWVDLWQAESAVSCRLAPGVGVAGVLRALCPPGSVTGTPKLSVLDLVGGLEPVGRGPAMGALGFWSGGRLRLGLTIRTVALDADAVHVWAGGGVTWRSGPAAEVAEAEAKASGVVRALGSVGA
ncbi:MAG TPA: chorismate-binding protein [Glycomyces sp.]|nr:chorismate-binding protein [Glycomyces sp.]